MYSAWHFFILKGDSSIDNNSKVDKILLIISLNLLGVLFIILGMPYETVSFSSPTDAVYDYLVWLLKTHPKRFVE